MSRLVPSEPARARRRRLLPPRQPRCHASSHPPSGRAGFASGSAQSRRPSSTGHASQPPATTIISRPPSQGAIGNGRVGSKDWSNRQRWQGCRADHAREPHDDRGLHRSSLKGSQSMCATSALHPDGLRWARKLDLLRDDHRDPTASAVMLISDSGRHGAADDGQTVATDGVRAHENPAQREHGHADEHHQLERGAPVDCEHDAEPDDRKRTADGQDR